ncbi:uncharacterized protein V1510DRAFT_344936, partial [Dipodascopsis tothii]|uniref:uncharacterized protein n=1 Tax=Dipodascopsis tothii TaxID=44089 RepID=UPI0034CE3286
RKRGHDFDEIEIDLSQPEPASKKQKRLEKKNKAKPVVQASVAAALEDGKRSPHGIWIGNLTFDTKRTDLREFFVKRTADAAVKINDADICRVNMPQTGKQNRGFAYVDFTTEAAMAAAIALSETPFNGRRVLIKSAQNFEGRAEKPTQGPGSDKNPATRILFVGNLPFETTQDNLQTRFTVPVKLKKGDDDAPSMAKIEPALVRMATFQDTGKCKGFAFIDYKTKEDAEFALKRIGTSIKMLGRKDIKVEFGQDRSNRHKKPRDENERPERPERPARGAADAAAAAAAAPGKKSKADRAARKNMPSGLALANAQRATAAIVPSTGKKITFDD